MYVFYDWMWCGATVIIVVAWVFGKRSCLITSKLSLAYLLVNIRGSHPNLQSILSHFEFLSANKHAWFILFKESSTHAVYITTERLHR